MRLLLSEVLPLRTTRMLGDFADDRVLPHRLGDLRDTRFHLVKLSSTTWFAADHAMQITDVQIDDESTTSWEQRTQGDDTGRVWTVVELGAPAPPDSSITASGIGRLNARTGRLIENPAEVMEYVLALAGRTERFPALRAECAAAALTAAGSLDVLKSIRSWLDEIAYSFGAIWTPETARFYPTPAARGPILTFAGPGEPSGAERILCEATLEDTCDVLRVSYNVDQTNDRAQRYVELTAKPMRYGGVSAEVVLKWLREPSNAESVGRRMLQRMAGDTYAVTLTAEEVPNLDRYVNARPCQWRRFENHPEWPLDNDDEPAVAMVLAVSVTPDQAAAEVALEFTDTPLPDVEVTAHSIAVPIGLGASVDLRVVPGGIEIGIGDQDGRPIRDAVVSLDGGPAKKTNAQGRAFFEVTTADPPRKHVLAVEAAGFTPFVLDVYL